MNIDSIKLGIQKAAPICVGYLPLGMALGVIARNSGLSIGEVAFMSLLLFSGSGQFIAVALLTIQTSFWAIIITILLVNLRYMLFSATISRYAKKLPPWVLAIICQGLTDETFVVSTTHFKHNPVDKQFWLTLNITSHLAWISSSVLGAAVGNFIPNMDKLGLNFALPAMFIALFFMTTNSKRAITVGLISGLISIMLLSWGISDANIIIATIIAATVGVMIQRWIPGS
ncbi:MAG: AzlC family ABC transporter permease [Bacillota bacterium]